MASHPAGSLVVPVRGRVVAALLVLTGLAGCAGVPSSGAVRAVRRVPVHGGLDSPDIRLLPPRPAPGASPADILRGFLVASADVGDSHAIAREFLAPAARAAWNDEAGVTVYKPASLTVDEVAGGQLRATVSQQATIAADGAYSVASGTVDRSFTVAKVDGEWRLSKVPDGVLLIENDVQRAYRPVDVFFLDPTLTLLVPDRIYLPVARRELPTAMVQALLRGPSGRLSPAVRTAVPDGTTLRGNVTVDGGTAVVDLSSVAQQTEPASRTALAAQIVFTLGQLPEVNGVSLQVEGRQLRAGSTPAVAVRSAYASFDPEGAAASGSGYYVVDGRLHQVDGRTVAGPAGDGALPVRSPAVAPGRLQLAALSGPVTDAVLVSGPLRGPLTARVSGGVLTGPSWGPGGRGVWVVRSAPRPEVLLVPDSAEPVRVAAPQLETLGPVQALQVSRDGARVAVVAGGTLYVGLVIAPRGAAVRLADFRPVAPTLRQVTDVTWQDADGVIALGATTTAPAAWRVEVDGSAVAPVTTSGLPSPPTAVAAAAGRPLLVESDGQVWAVNGGVASRLAAGGDPSYPG
ncbi:MAG: LpqB family beta-propeller domain-containing protein [Actinomycetota bacterium]|nr:LpqB family beta-propeller domain-containing protein [Actinomycetota bacterium]